MRFTDKMIIDSYIKNSLQMAEDPYLAVCDEVLGYTAFGGIVHDMTELVAFEARYHQLITPALASKIGVQRALESARTALEHEVQLTEANKELPLDQYFRLQDIVKVLHSIHEQNARNS